MEINKRFVIHNIYQQCCIQGVVQIGNSLLIFKEAEKL